MSRSSGGVGTAGMTQSIVYPGSVPEDGGYSKFIDDYFKVDGYVTQQIHGPQDASVTRYTLADRARILRDYTKIIQNWQQTQFSWVNQPDFIPVEYTKNFQHEVIFIEFGDDEYPEHAPLETVPRYLTMTRNVMLDTSERYNLGFPFENQSMATEEGQEEFGMFSARLTFMFTELVSRLSLMKLLDQNPGDGYYFNPKDDISLEELEALLIEERARAFIGNKSGDGAIMYLLKIAKIMEQYHSTGGYPSHILFNSEKTPLLLQNQGPLTINTSTKDAAVILDMAFRSMPNFSTQTKKKKDIGSMLSTTVEIGNMFVFDPNNLMEIPADKREIALHGKQGVFNEAVNGLQDISWVQLNKSDTRWAADGSLHSNHDGKATDMFTYYDELSDQYKRCRIIGDMKPDVLPMSIVRAMVKSFMVKVDTRQLSADLRTVRTQFDNEAAENEFYNGEEYQNASERLVEFSERCVITFGSALNPLFTTEPMACDQVGDDKRRRNARRLARNVFKIQDPFEPPHRQFKMKNNETTAGLSDGLEDISGTHPCDVLAFEELQKTLMALRTSIDGSTSIRRRGKGYTHLINLVDRFIANAERYKREPMVNLSSNEVLAANTLLTTLEDGGSDGAQLEENLLKFEHFIMCLQEANSRNIDVDELLSGNGYRRSYADILSGKAGLASFPKPTKDQEFDPNAQNIVPQVRDMDDMHVFSDIKVWNVYTDDPDVKRPRETFADQVGDHDNIALNVKRVEDEFYNEIERAVAYLILLTPIHRDVFTRLLEENIMIPMKFIVGKPQMTYQTEGVCICQTKNGGLGKAFLGYPAAEIGKSAKDMTGMMHVAQYVSVVVPQNRRRWKILDMWYRKAMGGANNTFYTYSQWQQHAGRGFMTMGYNRPSCVALSVPVDSQVSPELHVSGKKHIDEEQYHYASWEFYGHHLRFSEFELDHVMMHQRSGNVAPNGLMYAGTQALRGLDGRYQTVEENTGHNGIERAGCLQVRQGGDTKINTSIPLI